MKKLTLPVLLITLLCGTYTSTSAQVWKRVRKEVKARLDKVSSGSVADSNASAAAAANTRETASAPAPVVGEHRNYDFVPGDRIIFKPDISGEPDGELPARFTIRKGGAEMQLFQGEKVLHLDANASSAVEPLMNTDHYLPEQFTLEFDVMYENSEGSYFRYASDFRIGFLKAGDQNYYNGGLYAFVINGTSKCAFGPAGVQEFPPALEKSFGMGNTWHHIAIYVRGTIGKAYIDSFRVCATNALAGGADRFYIKADRYGVKIRNLRLAAGGEDQYQKVITEGKLVTHDITFDVNKAVIRSESMGVLSQVATMMKAHGDLKFDIEGHTDSTGTAQANQTLSQSRAEAVKAGLVALGVDQSRLTATGFGASRPIDTNQTAEGRANNRRVEFVKR